ncbi:hypothetical protein CANARDRAFT_174585 [[Candida] arabinofermentans NRRL YB-2248]|uniref:Transcription elongation factor Spt6 n=1 Tax=[Candida] arabinofermentans NRRL YB-2248 TaxID=983967 RepID=A0A1E4T763_9ASCO|nr:hypothetical protein CANARDRAFT_174585 [[Candida] arabinofermentans NRRL YB-2248]
MSDLESDSTLRTKKEKSDFVDIAAEHDDDDDQDDDSNLIDSSEEDEDEEEDEEAIRKVREGFIVDDEGDDDELDDDDDKKKRKRHKKRRRESSKKSNDAGDDGIANDDNDDELDEDDLELLRENAGELPSHLAEKSKFKRLKRGGNDDTDLQSGKNLTDMFSDEEAQAQDDDDDDDIDDDDDDDDDDLLEASRKLKKNRQQDLLGEFDDFIEDDEFSDDDDEDKEERLARIRSSKAQQNNFQAHSQFDQDKLDELYEIFGDGNDYGWALEAENVEDDDEEGEEQDDEEGSEDVDEDGNPIKKSKKEPKALKEVFEYEELKEYLLTDKDQEIRISDIPERFQALREGIKNYDLNDEEFANKQQWIADILYEENISMFQDKDNLIEPFKKSVAQIVFFISKENLEVPTIWSCRKDYTLYTYRESGQLRVQKLLNENDLWRIVQLDIDYHTMLEKKKSIENMFNSLDTVDLLYDEFIDNAKTTIELQDLQDYLSFTYSSELKDLKNTGTTTTNGKKQKSHSKYSVFERIKNDQIYKVIKEIGIDSEKFGENVNTNNKIYLTDDYDKKPEDLIKEIVENGSYFSSIDRATNAIKHMFSEQLIHNPKLRTHLRLAFQNYANFDIELTEKGKTKITDDSPYADFKYAINRTTETLIYKPDLFLRMLEAESLGYVNIKIGLKNASENFLNHLFSLLASDGTSDISNSWNKLRKDCLIIALKKLIPIISQDVKEKIRLQCEKLLFFEIRESFMNKVDQAPYHPVPNVKGTIPKVLSVSNGDAQKDAAVIAIAMDYDGTVSEHVKFEDNFKSLEFGEKFINLVKRFKPEVVAISGYNVNCSILFKRIQELIVGNNILVEVDIDDNYQDNNDNDIQLPVIYVPNETARLFEHSDRANQEFSDKPVVAKFCIGIARYVQSPLLEYISLGKSITSISIHKHQNLLSEEKLLQAIESIFVDVSCLVGIKINDAVRSNYLSSMLQYIAGLGPRKASSLIKNIEASGGSLLRRDGLILNNLTTKIIFINCAPFIEIPVPDRHDKDIELLDATRIHPEDYELARKMASDALDLSEEEKEELEQEEGGVINKLYEEGVEKLDELLLEGYADQLEEHGHKKRATLEMIKEELQNNYEELRKSFHLLTEDEIFQLLTSETKESFQRSMMIPVIIQRVDNRFMMTITQSGIIGNISRSNILPYGDNSSILTKYQPGQAIQAVIKSVDYGSFRAELSILKEDLQRASIGKKIDKFENLWDFESELKDKKLDNELENKDENMKRFLKHPYFRNFNSKQAEDYLASKSSGEFVIRPSSKGNDHLTITWKIENQLFQHIDVIEHDKLNEYSLGRILQVGNFKYHDLDELIVSHINNLHLKVEEIKNHEKFNNEPLNDVQDWLIRYSKANKNRSCYCFCFNHKSPGWFYLLFKLNDNKDKVYTWNIKVLPNGYQLHNNLYPDMIHLCNGFKKLLQNQMNNANANANANASAGRSNAGGNYGGYGGNGYRY